VERVQQKNNQTQGPDVFDDERGEEGEELRERRRGRSQIYGGKKVWPDRETSLQREKPGRLRKK